MSDSEEVSSQGDPASEDEQEDTGPVQKSVGETDEDIGELDSDEEEEDKILRDIRAEVDPLDPDVEADEASAQELESDEADDGDDSDVETSDEELEDFAKLTEQLRSNTVQRFHPSLSTGTDEYVQAMSCIRRDEKGDIVDANHRTLPILSKYEKTRILGIRSAQIATGAPPCIKKIGVTDPFEIAVLELEAGKAPFVVKRPLPDGKCEYWRAADLQLNTSTYDRTPGTRQT